MPVLLSSDLSNNSCKSLNGMPKKKPMPKDEKPQSERFKEVARNIGADESGEKFERAVKKIVPPVKPKPIS